MIDGIREGLNSRIAYGRFSTGDGLMALAFALIVVGLAHARR